MKASDHFVRASTGVLQCEHLADMGGVGCRRRKADPSNPSCARLLRAGKSAPRGRDDKFFGYVGRNKKPDVTRATTGPSCNDDLTFLTLAPRATFRESHLLLPRLTPPWLPR